jgi:hypothetical protein
LPSQMVQFYSAVYTAAGTDNIDSVTLYDGMRVVETKKIGGIRDVKTVFKCESPANKQRPYLIEVVQCDGNRAWTTPVWVARKSVPNLKWQNAGAGVSLVNTGLAAAHNIELWHSRDEHPFTLEPIEGRYCGDDEEAGFVWSIRRDHRKTILHYRWHGKPIKARAAIKGSLSYAVELNSGLRNRGSLKDDSQGNIEFETGIPISPAHAQGFAVVTDVDPERPCYAVFDFESPVKTLIGKKTELARSVIVPLNGRQTDQKPDMYTIPAMLPGGRWLKPDKEGFWTADPLGNIDEINEQDNLYPKIL